MLYCLKKKKMEKWPFLVQNHGLTPLEKCNFSTVWTSDFYILERCFFVLEYRKRHFPGLYCLKKNGKMATFGPKAWFYPFGKMSIFMGLTHGFGPKMGLFPTFLFRQYSIGKCPLRYSRMKKHLSRL